MSAPAIIVIVTAWLVFSTFACLFVARCIPPSDRSHPQQGDADVRGEGGGGSIHEGTYE